MTSLSQFKVFHVLFILVSSHLLYLNLKPTLSFNNKIFTINFSEEKQSKTVTYFTLSRGHEKITTSYNI